MFVVLVKSDLGPENATVGTFGTIHSNTAVPISYELFENLQMA